MLETFHSVSLATPASSRQPSTRVCSPPQSSLTAWRRLINLSRLCVTDTQLVVEGSNKTRRRFAFPHSWVVNRSWMDCWDSHILRQHRTFVKVTQSVLLLDCDLCTPIFVYRPGESSRWELQRAIHLFGTRPSLILSRRFVILAWLDQSITVFQHTEEVITYEVGKVINQMIPWWQMWAERRSHFHSY